MTNPTPLSTEQITEALKALPRWQVIEGALSREVSFETYVQAVSFVNAVAQLAEAQNHHPKIVLEYGRVTVQYWTHSVHGLTPLDFDAARDVDALIRQNFA